jgi:hypothetical protein
MIKQKGAIPTLPTLQYAPALPMIQKRRALPALQD